jgi:O-antigen/teichoic acid export membrane protein
VLKRFSTTALMRIMGAGANLVQMLSITWLTGAFEAGIFLFAYSIMIILATVSRLGSELSGMREVASLCDSGNTGLLLRATRARLLMTAVMSVLCAGLFSFYVAPFAETRFGGEHTSTSINLLALTLPAFALLGLFTEFLKAVDRATIAVFYQNTMVPLLAVAGLIAVSYVQPVGAEGTAAVMLFGTWVTLGSTVFTWMKWRRARPKSARSAEEALTLTDFTQILRDSPALAVVSSTPIIMQWIGASILGFLAEAEHVAGFSVAVRLSISVSIVNSAVISVMAPRMAAAYAVGKMDVLRRLSHQTSVIIMGVTAPVLSLVYVLAGTWLSFFGMSFSAYATELRVLVVGQIVAAAIGHSGSVLVMAGLYREARLTSIVAGFGLLLAMLVSTPLFGTVGAAAAMSVGVIAGHLAGVFLARWKLEFWTVPLNVDDLRDALRSRA